MSLRSFGSGTYNISKSTTKRSECAMDHIVSMPLFPSLESYIMKINLIPLSCSIIVPSITTFLISGATESTEIFLLNFCLHQSRGIPLYWLILLADMKT